MITVLNLGISNLGSLVKAFQLIGAKVTTTNNPETITNARCLILPGVGAFGAAAEALSRLKLRPAILSAVDSGAWILGVCLGMQLLVEESEEFGIHRGLGLVPGKVKGLPVLASPYLVPNIGWRYVDWKLQSTFKGLALNPSYYFAHSYHVVLEEPAFVVATTRFGGSDLAAGIQHDRVIGFQFHPEKSQTEGMHLLAEFVRLSRQ